MGRTGAPVYPATLASGERECLNCGDPFTPSPTGWRALYCQESCWIANNGGPRRNRTAYRPRPIAAPPMPAKGVDQLAKVVPVADVMTPEEAVAAAEPEPPAPAPAHLQPVPSRLVVVGTVACPACGTTHEEYGLRGAL
jgi:hypothetical protein